MENTLIEIASVCFVLMLGWLHLRQNRLEDALNKKADSVDIKELKGLIKELNETLTEARLEQSEWRGMINALVKKN